MLDDHTGQARPRLLDLFCCAGGASMGYWLAGFDVTGVDINPQPHYPFDFFQADVLELTPEVLEDFDAIHASPPCQFRTAYKRRPDHVAESPNLIPATRALLQRSWRPYVIENVEFARDQLRDPIRICGSSFGLDVRRHRLFESSVPLNSVACDHSWQTPRFTPASNRSNLRSTVEIGVWRIPVEVQERAMGIDWMDLPELSQAIPPAYTEFVGAQLMAGVQSTVLEHTD
jgi:DNA (cytosine-5)-methyltransferase 1